MIANLDLPHHSSSKKIQGVDGVLRFPFSPPPHRHMVKPATQLANALASDACAWSDNPQSGSRRPSPTSGSRARASLTPFTPPRGSLLPADQDHPPTGGRDSTVHPAPLHILKSTHARFARQGFEKGEPPSQPSVTDASGIAESDLLCTVNAIPGESTIHDDNACERGI